jgi:hypothetical protein
MTEPLALRCGQTDWETEMWARALVAFAITGERPSVPLFVTEDDWAQVQQAIAEFAVERRRP